MAKINLEIPENLLNDVKSYLEINANDEAKIEQFIISLISRELCNADSKSVSELLFENLEMRSKINQIDANVAKLLKNLEFSEITIPQNKSIVEDAPGNEGVPEIGEGNSIINQKTIENNDISFDEEVSKSDITDEEEKNDDDKTISWEYRPQR